MQGKREPELRRGMESRLPIRRQESCLKIAVQMFHVIMHPGNRFLNHSSLFFIFFNSVHFFPVDEVIEGHAQGCGDIDGALQIGNPLEMQPLAECAHWHADMGGKYRLGNIMRRYKNFHPSPKRSNIHITNINKYRKFVSFENDYSRRSLIGPKR